MRSMRQTSVIKTNHALWEAGATRIGIRSAFASEPANATHVVRGGTGRPPLGTDTGPVFDIQERYPERRESCSFRKTSEKAGTRI